MICECTGGFGTWNSEGTILFGTPHQPIHRISASGGKPARVFNFDTAREEATEAGPYFLPDGNHFLYSGFAKGDGASMLGSLDGKTRRFLFTNTESPALYAPNPAGGGWLLYVAGGQLFARPFNAEKGEITGGPALVADSIGGGASWSTSANGLLTFRHTYSHRSQLTWFDRKGAQVGTSAESGNLDRPRISPDQKTVAFVRTEARNSDIWLLDIARNASTRFTSNPGADGYPVWSTDGNRILFLSTRQHERVLMERPANGVSSETILLKEDAVRSKFYGVSMLFILPTGQTADGRRIVATEIYGSNAMVWLLSTVENVKPVLLAEGADATISPDGRWLLYVSNISRPEAFVQSLPKEAGGPPSVAGRWQISTAGGGNPVWRGDGKEIFYLASDGKMMAVPIESNENFFRPGAPKPLFQTRLLPGPFRDYDVARDGKRFLLNVPLADNENEPITVIVNWPKLLEK